MTPRLSPAFEAYIRPARGYPQLWRLALGCGVIVLTYLGLLVAIISAAGALAGSEAMMRTAAEAETPAGTLVLLATFLGMAVGPMLAAWLLHARAPSTLFGHAPRVLRHFAAAAALSAAIYLPPLAAWFWAFDAVPRLDPALWLTLLPLGLAGLALQTGAEELVFRGYLQQQLAARFRSPIAWMILPSLVFGVVHFDPNTAGSNAALYAAATAVFALAAADLTARTGSLGAAWGLHFANNVFAVLIVAVDGTLPGLALYTTPYSADDTGTLRLLIAGDIAVLVLAWAALRRTLGR
ncbi:MAG: type II CAAX endopeptidase family protein [Rhodobacter sp.]|nr:type II CAAX endopeptidase family protein [Rhodobacter sp.]